MYSALQTPLTELEFEELGNLLLGDNMPDEAMDISSLDGYMTALASSPIDTLPTEMLMWVWDCEKGCRSPEFENIEDISRIMELIMRHWNSVVSTLREAPFTFEPLIFERSLNNTTIPIIDEWCMGYCTGMRLHQTKWAELQNKHPQWFKVFFLYGTEAGWDELSKIPASAEQHQVNANTITQNVLNIFNYWQKQPRQTHKIGRNEPCPCGSGKKYKHCHALIKNEPPLFVPPSDHFEDDIPDLYNSSLNQTIHRDGKSIQILIYSLDKMNWTLEVEDEHQNSTVWNERFTSEESALQEVLRTIDQEGIESLIGEPSTSKVLH